MWFGAEQNDVDERKDGMNDTVDECGRGRGKGMEGFSDVSEKGACGKEDGGEEH